MKLEIESGIGHWSFSFLGPRVQTTETEALVWHSTGVRRFGPSYVRHYTCAQTGNSKSKVTVRFDIVSQSHKPEAVNDQRKTERKRLCIPLS